MSWNRAKFAPLVLVIIGAALIATSQLVALPWAGAQAGTTYYVDCSGGNDSHNGTSQANAWKTLAPVKSAKLSPGDSLLFKRGCTWQGPFQAKWTGTASAPIRIGAYGNGAAPKFAHGNTTNVMITGAYQVIEDLQTQHVVADYDIASDGQPMSWKIGFNFQNGAHHNTVQRVRTGGHAAGVNFAANTHHNRVLNSFIGNNFGMWSNTTASTGVLLHGDANEIAYNHFENNVALKRPERSVSLEIFNNTRGNIHHNVSYDRKFAELGSGNRTSADNVIAHNVHWSDFEPKGNAKGALFVVTRGEGCNFGPVRNTIVQNNTVYLSGANSEGVSAGCTKDGNVITLKNNIIVARQKGYFLGGGGAVESHSTYWPVGGLPVPNNFLQGQEMHATSQIADPQFVDAPNRDLRLKSGSPAANQGASSTAGSGSGTAGDGGGGDGGSGGDPVVEPEIPASMSVPGRIQAEDYRKGGPGVGYHDTTAGNTGGAYRNDDVDIQGTQDAGGGFNVGWIRQGEWLAYNIEVPASGRYVFTFRVASPHNGQSLHAQINDVNVTGSVSVPNTGGWQSFTDVSSQPVDIAAGSYTLKVMAESGGYNLNYIDVTVVEPEIPASMSVPGRIQAEDYRKGGPGVGYHDTTAGNTGGAYRNDDVDIQVTQDTDGGYNVGWIDAGEWLAYNIEVSTSGRYVFTFRTATIHNGQSLHVLLNDVNVTGSVSVPNTGGWQAFTDVSSQAVDIAAGSYTLKVVAESKAYNLNYIDVAVAESNQSAAVASEIPASTSVPGRIQAENYREGGPGVGYHDTTPGNTGGAYRNDDVDIQVTQDTDGGYNVGWIREGEWLAYNVEVPANGRYVFTFRVASVHNGQSLHVLLNEENVTGSVGILNTGGWQDYTDVSSQAVDIAAGSYTLKVVAESNGYNLNYIDVTEASQAAATGMTTMELEDESSNETDDALNASFAVGCNELECRFDASGSTGAIETYSWDFGDGSRESGAVVSHLYSEGTYTAALTITDAAGHSSTISQEVVVAATAETSTAATFVHSCDPLTRTCEFDASLSEGDINGYEWDFGDGSPAATGEVVSHTYSGGGGYTVTLSVSNGRATHSDSQKVVLPFTMHVADLEGSAAVDGQNWTAEVTVTVHDEDDNPLAGVTVVGVWDNSGSTEFSCVTDEDGQCTIDNRVSGQLTSAEFEVIDLRHATHVYDQSEDQVPEQDDTDDERDGTSITVSLEQ